jgi:peptidoglycan/xylan/chitin deacetylase (PgdA/CDA1 family)
MKTVSAGRFEVLVYHRIGPENSLDGLTVSKEIFTKQMRFIQRHCRPMALADLVRALREGEKIPQRAVAVTFDDGYRDTFKVAFPVLQNNLQILN